MFDLQPATRAVAKSLGHPAHETGDIIWTAVLFTGRISCRFLFPEFH